MTKAARRAIWIIIILVIVAVCMHIGLFLMIEDSFRWQFAADYDKYDYDFNVVMDYIETQFAGESDKRLYVSTAGGNGVMIYDPDTEEYFQLPSDVLLSLETIYRYGFPDKDSQFDAIRIQKGRISFCISYFVYALVFSPNEKPSWINSPKENRAIWVRSIGGGWYHVTENPG